jgi:hypothetical protein
VTEGTGGQTSATLSTLPANADYFWHVQAIAGGTTGLFSAPSKFTIGPAVSLGAPGLVSPANGSTVSTQPTLTVSNASKSGSVGAVVYRFDISTSPTFATIAFQGNAAEGSGQTSFVPGTALAVSTTFYWRATAIDTTNNATGPASATGNFTTLAFAGVAANIASQMGLVLWPGAVPGGSNGHAGLGDNWQIQTLYYVPGNVTFQAPQIGWLRIFDLLDRGYDPQSGIDWLQANNYGGGDSGAWYPGPVVIGFQYVYLSARGGVIGNGSVWDVVLKVE